MRSCQAMTERAELNRKTRREAVKQTKQQQKRTTTLRIGNETNTTCIALLRQCHGSIEDVGFDATSRFECHTKTTSRKRTADDTSVVSVVGSVD